MSLTWIGLLVAAQAAIAAPPTTLPPDAHGHPYRHGVVPQRGHQASSSAPTAPSQPLSYGGGVGGVGVTSGPPKVYLVFWGSQWGTQGIDSNGYVTLSGDPNGMAPYVQAFLKGLGTGGEQWSGVMTQYCQGVTAGAQSCSSSNGQHVGYPYGGALAGVWVDESSAAPASASGNQIGAEAVTAATHFGNTSSSANRNAQYVVVSPTGTNPDGWLNPRTGFCAWHDYTGDTTLTGGAVSSPDGPLAFTNLPYLTDAGTSCGQSFVNSGSAGTLDGVSIVEGHEYAETITDQFPAGGWTDSTGNENGDKCAWIASGHQGASQNITLTTGTFAVQSTWSNANTACEVTHSVLNNVTVTNPGNETSFVGQPITSLQIAASDSDSKQTLTYSATGLPAGLTLDSATGVISGTPTTVGSSSVTVTATDTTGASGSASFSWTVTKRSTSTSVSCTPNSVAVGVQSTCTATVSDTSSGSASTPGGSVSFSGSPTSSGSFSSTTCTLAPTGTTGLASCQTDYTPSATGGETITGNYAGDAGHSTSTSSGFGLTSTNRSSSASVVCTPATVGASSSTSCTVTVSDTNSGTATSPTGTVSFAAAPTGQGSFTTSSCSLSPGTTGTASCSVSYTPSSAGSQTITASYPGDATHSSSTSSGYAITVSAASTSGGSGPGGGGQSTQTATPNVPPPSNTGGGTGNSPPPPPPFCASASSLGRSGLGLVTLGMKRGQARAAYLSGLLSGGRYQDLFCQTLRVGYASPAVLSKLRPSQRTSLSGQVIWVVTTDQRYSVRGVRIGLRLPAVKRALGAGQRLTIHGTVWYLFRGQGATVLVAIRGGVVSEIGMANAQLTKTAAAAARLLRTVG